MVDKKRFDDDLPGADAGPGERSPLAPEERYEREELLGQGGMARVYRAHDRQLGRRVALKFLDYPDAAMRRRFLAEARSQARVRHDNVLEVYEAGELDGTPYIAMRYVAGRTLLEIRDETSLEEKVRLLALVAEGLHAAHREGLLHRDVKPSNILIEETPDGKKPWVADFGIAAEEGEGAADRAGTPYFMAPERLRSGAAVDRRSDVYSLGVTMYQLFSGALPFDDTIVTEGLRQVLEDEPRSLAETAPDLPAELRAIVMKCLAKEPAGRYASARAVAEDLRRFLDGEIVEAYTASLAYRLTRFALRHRVALGISAAALLLLLVASSIATVMGVQAVRANEVAQWRRGQAESLIGFMLGDLREKLDAIGKSAILADVGVRAMEYFGSVPEDELTVEELLGRSKAHHQIGQVHHTQGDLSAAQAAMTASLELAKELAARDPERQDWLLGLGTAHYWVGHVARARGRLDDAEEHFRSYLEATRHLVGRDPENADHLLELSYAYTNLGVLEKERSEIGKALEYFRASVEIKERLALLAPEDPVRRRELANSHSWLAETLMAQRDFAGALAAYRTTLEILRSLLEREPDNRRLRERLGYAHANFARAFEALSRFQEALEHFSAARTIFEDLKLHDPHNADWRWQLAIARGSTGRVLHDARRLEPALLEMAAALEIMQRLVREDPANRLWQRELARRHHAAGLAELERGGLDEAESHAAAADRILGRLQEEDETPRVALDYGENLLLVGRVAHRIGRGEQARVILEKARDLLRELAASNEAAAYREGWLRSELVHGARAVPRGHPLSATVDVESLCRRHRC